MPSDTKIANLTLQIDAGKKADEEELAELTRQLRKELLDLDVEAVDLVRTGEIPERAKAGDPITWGMLLLTLAASGGALTAVIGLVQAWLTRHGQSSVSVKLGEDELTVTGKPTAEQQQLIDVWLNRHKGFLIAND